MSIIHRLGLMAAAHPVVPLCLTLFCVDYRGGYPEVGSPGDISSGCSPYRLCVARPGILGKPPCTSQGDSL